MIDTSSAPVAGWYPDPADPASHRWWDGFVWTDHTRPQVVVAAQVAPVVTPAYLPAPTFVPTSGPIVDSAVPAFGSLDWRDRAAAANVHADAETAERTPNVPATVALVAGILIAVVLAVCVYFGLPTTVTRWVGSLIVIILGIGAARRSRTTGRGRMRSLIALGLGVIVLAPVLFPVLIDVIPTLLSFVI